MAGIRTLGARTRWTGLRWATAVLGSSLLLVSGCASVIRPPTVNSTSAQADAAHRWAGHISLKLAPFGDDGARGMSLAFDLQGQADQGSLDLSTPLGTLVASVRWAPGQARLHTADGVDSYASLGELVARVLGEALPVPSLMFWLQGLPDPQLPSQPTDRAGTTYGFVQAGWQVDTSGLAESGALLARRDAQPDVRGATLRVRLER